MNVKENRKELYLKYLLPNKLIKLSRLEFQKFLGNILKTKYGPEKADLNVNSVNKKISSFLVVSFVSCSKLFLFLFNQYKFILNVPFSIFIN